MISGIYDFELFFECLPHPAAAVHHIRPVPGWTRRQRGSQNLEMAERKQVSHSTILYVSAISQSNMAIYIYIYLDLRSSVNLWLFACSYMFLANRAHFHITSGNCPNEHLLNFHYLSLIKGACLAKLMEPRPLNNSVEIL